MNVAQEELNSFLMIAEELKVKGLTQGADSGGGGQKRAKSPSSRQTTQVPVKRPRQSDASANITRAAAVPQDDDDIQEVMPAVVKAEPGQETSVAPGQHLATYDEESYGDYGQYDDTQEYDGSMMVDYQQTGLDGNKGKLLIHWQLFV